MIQLRDKNADKQAILTAAQRLRKALCATRTLFIINDYVDIAKIADSDGLHLGQSDISVRLARRILGKDKIIGVSCSTLRQARAACEAGADYIGIGPAFPTATKPESRPISLTAIDAIRRALDIPFFILGGITMQNLNLILSHRIRTIAVCRSICSAGDIRAATRKMKQALLN
jgi:thiamine-phosphate pyrophosphorylase